MIIVKSMSMIRVFVVAIPIVTSSVALTGCGSGDSSTEASVLLDGSVFASPVSGANCVLQDKNGVRIADNISTSPSGHYSIDLQNAVLDDDLQLICNGGTYVDEADGSNQTAGEMTAYAPGGTLGVNTAIHVTPGSTIIHSLITRHGKSYADAQAVFNSAFGFTPNLAVEPTDATRPKSGSSESELLAGLRAATFSQLTMDFGLAAGQQFDLLAALAKDLSDGELDGKDASAAVTISGTSVILSAGIRNQFASALLNFRTGNDASGLNNDKIGTLPFAKTAFTGNYRLDYVAGMMGAMQGKTMFGIELKDRLTEAAVTGASMNLMPMMYMAMHSHSTPVDGACTETATAGTYSCTLYYLMASQMMNGDSMGYWDLTVMVNDEAAHFYPSVMMGMGDTTRADLKGVDDKLMNMMTMTTEGRRYHIFKSSLSGMSGNHSFQVFIAARETMMAFPALADGAVFNAGEMNELSVNGIIVEISTDLTSWVTAAADGNGYWTASGLGGLTNGTEGNIYVKLSVSGEQKSTNGQVAGGDNAYATFSVTPGDM